MANHQVLAPFCLEVTAVLIHHLSRIFTHLKVMFEANIAKIDSQYMFLNVLIKEDFWLQPEVVLRFF